MHSLKKRAIGHRRAGGMLIEILLIPPSRHAGSKQCLDFGSDINRAIVNGIMKWFDAKPVPSGIEDPIPIVPQYERKLATQMLHAMRAKIFVQVQSHLTVRKGPEPVTTLGQLAPLTFKIVKLPIHDDVNAAVLVCDRLVPCRKVDNTQSRVSQANALVSGEPRALTIRA